MLAGSFAVAGSEDVHEFGVLDDRMLHVGDVGEIEVPQPIGLGVEHVKGVDEEPVAGGFPHNLVAAAIDLHQVEVADGRVGGIERRGHGGPVFVGAAGCRETSGIGLKHGAGLEQHRQLGHIDAAQEHAAAGIRRDEVLPCQAVAGLADRCAAHAERFLQCLFAQDIAGREVEAHDHAAQLPVGLFGEGKLGHRSRHGPAVDPD